MPLYEYVCTACDHGFEALVSSSEAPPHCPQCEATGVKRVLSRFAASTSSSSSPASAMSACGSCGDPRGPGACRFDN